jgi:Helix-turn-helix domain
VQTLAAGSVVDADHADRSHWATATRYSIVPEGPAVTAAIKAAIEMLNANPDRRIHAKCSVSTALNVYGRFAGYATRSGVCWPKQDDVATVAGVSVDQLARAIRVLVTAGLMVVDPVFRANPGGGMRRVGTRYHLVAPKRPVCPGRAQIRTVRSQGSEPRSKPEVKSKAVTRGVTADVIPEMSEEALTSTTTPAPHVSPRLSSVPTPEAKSKAARKEERGGSEPVVPVRRSNPGSGGWGNHRAWYAFWAAWDAAHAAGDLSEWDGPVRGAAGGVANAMISATDGTQLDLYAAEIIRSYLADEYCGGWDDAAADALGLEPPEYAEASGRTK